MTSAESQPRSLSYLVLLISGDARIQNHLAPALAAVDASVELQVVPSPAILRRYLSNLVPDALIVDHTTLSSAELLDLLAKRPAGKGPVLVLAREQRVDSKYRQALLHHGACELIARGPGDVDALRDALVTKGRVARLHGSLDEQARHYHDILEALHDAVFVLDQGIFSYVNHSFAQLLGRSVSTLLGRVRLIDCVAPHEQAVVATELARLEVNRGTPSPLTFNLTTANDAGVLFEACCHASLIQGVQAVVGVGRDVTALRQAQQELELTRRRAAQVERLRALGELSAGVAHDFNNALGTILGRVTLARDKMQRGENVLDDLEVIELASRHAASTVQRVQEFSRPSRTDSWGDVDLAEVCVQAADFIRTRVPNRVQLLLETAAVPSIRGNPSELREVLLNLLRNALDAVGDSGTVGMRCSTSADGHVVIEVWDDGHGMSTEVQQRLFQPFFSTKAQAGTGLGLSVSHWILRRHDAQIHIDSAPNQGARFHLTFEPFAPSTWVPATAQPVIQSILVVDDDITVADMLRDLLMQQGFAVRVVSSAGAALESLAQTPVDLVITDLDLPDLGGWQLARRLHDVQPNVLVGLMTGWPLGASSDELQARGIGFVLNKPFSTEALLRSLSRL